MMPVIDKWILRAIVFWIAVGSYLWYVYRNPDSPGMGLPWSLILYTLVVGLVAYYWGWSRGRKLAYQEIISDDFRLADTDCAMLTLASASSKMRRPWFLPEPEPYQMPSDALIKLAREGWLSRQSDSKR